MDHKPFIASGEFWLGVFTVIFGLLIAFGLIDLFFLD